jgi:histidyl-tRNA synthetase
VSEELRDAGLSPNAIESILRFAEIQGKPAVILQQCATELASSERAAEGIERLRELLEVAALAGVPEGRIQIDLSIARGLDYYTGTIFETFLDGHYTDDQGHAQSLAGFGSVCSGGRYDNLASLYTKQVLPGVGASLGVDRLLAAMEAMKHPWLSGVSTPAPVFIVQFPGGPLGVYQKTARDLRAAGIATEVYPEPKKLGLQFQYADKRGFTLVLIAGPDDFARGEWQMKDLRDGQQVAVPAAELIQQVQDRLRR